MAEMTKTRPTYKMRLQTHQIQEHSVVYITNHNGVLLPVTGFVLKILIGHFFNVATMSISVSPSKQRRLFRIGKCNLQFTLKPMSKSGCLLFESYCDVSCHVEMTETELVLTQCRWLSWPIYWYIQSRFSSIVLSVIQYNRMPSCIIFLSFSHVTC